MLKIVNNQHPKFAHDPKVGEFYSRFDGGDGLYIVTMHDDKDNIGGKFGLINVSTGNMYSDPKNFIGNIFGDHSDKFYLITKDITIVID